MYVSGFKRHLPNPRFREANKEAVNDSTTFFSSKFLLILYQAVLVEKIGIPQSILSLPSGPVLEGMN